MSAALTGSDETGGQRDNGPRDRDSAVPTYVGIVLPGEPRDVDYPAGGLLSLFHTSQEVGLKPSLLPK